MKQRFPQMLIGLQLLSLLVGTQMPGAWRSGAEQTLHAPSWFSSFSHFALFTGMAMVLALRPFAWPVARIVLAALALALLTEGLQLLAIDRHPRLLDVGIDMAGTVFALALVKGRSLCTVHR